MEKIIKCKKNAEGGVMNAQKESEGKENRKQREEKASMLALEANRFTPSQNWQTILSPCCYISN